MANVYWTGGAPAKFDVWDITLANTWAASDIARITIGNKDLLITVGSSTLATIATEIIASVNATDFDTPAPPSNFSRNVGGQQIPEFTEITASAHPTDTAIVRITANTAGVPIGLTAGETTAGDGTFTASNSTVATGPNHIDDPDNYLGGSLPVDNDVLYFERGAVSALYGLTYFRANNIDLSIVITGDWTGQLGLETDNDNGYSEYRQRYFQVRGGSKSLSVEPGILGNTSQGSLWLDLQDQAAVAITIGAARGSGSTPTIFLAGADASTLTNTLVHSAGHVVIEPDDAPTGATKYAAFSSITTGRESASDSASSLYIGRNTRIHKASTLTVNSGTVTVRAATKSGADECNISIHGGSLEMDYTGASADVTVSDGGTFYPRGAIDFSGGALVVYSGGTYDSRRSNTTGTPGVLTAYSGAAIYEPVIRYLDQLQPSGCRLNDLTLIMPINISAIS